MELRWGPYGAECTCEALHHLSAPHQNHLRTLTLNHRPSPSRCSGPIRLPHSVITNAPVPPRPGSFALNHGEMEWAANCGIATVIKETLLIFIHIITDAVALLLHCIKKKKMHKVIYPLLLAICVRENNTRVDWMSVWVEQVCGIKAQIN